MADIIDIECLRHVTNLQTGLVLREARLAEEAIGQGRVIAIAEDDEDRPGAFHVSRNPPRPHFCQIIPFPIRK